MDNDWVTRGGNDVVNTGLGLDRAVGGPGDDLLIVDYSIGDDAALGGLTFFVDGTCERRNTATNTAVDRIFMAGFERHHLTGTSKADSAIPMPVPP